MKSLSKKYFELKSIILMGNLVTKNNFVV